MILTSRTGVRQFDYDGDDDVYMVGNVFLPFKVVKMMSSNVLSPKIMTANGFMTQNVRKCYFNDLYHFLMTQNVRKRLFNNL